MKLHDLKPAAGSRKARMRVGRGIAAGKGKTAGRGTKGQKSRAGASIPAWFEGGQTPIHIRVPKLRGFKRRFKIEYQVVNVGRLSEYAAAGRFGVEADGPPTINAEVLASAGLIGTLRQPVKVLGLGDVDRKLFVAADLFSASARRKIEDAGGFVQVLTPPKSEPATDEAATEEPPTEQPTSPAEPATAAQPADEPMAAEEPAPAEAVGAVDPASSEEPPTRTRRPRAERPAENDSDDDADGASGSTRRPRRSSRPQPDTEA
ncbi:hypothetical protein BH23CHL6_BH23CHL6_02740 [soil metagenome]